MEETKTVKITDIEERVSEAGNTYWRIRTLPVLVPKKAIFLQRKSQVELLEKEHYYSFVYDLNDAGYVEIKAFEEVIDQNQDMKDEAASTPAPKSTDKPKSKGSDFRAPIEIVREKSNDFANQFAMKVMEITKKEFLVADVIAIADTYENYQLNGRPSDEES